MAVYAVADLHGRYDLFQQIKDFIKPEDTVYVLGDCGDRGSGGWAIIKEVYANPQFVYIRGNHENMLIQAMRGDALLCFYNGGMSTFKDWKNDPERVGWASKLQALPTFVKYNNVLLTHAGFTPNEEFGIPRDEDLIWDRTHFNDEWEEGQNCYIVHGHTPIPYMNDYLEEEHVIEPGALWYCMDKKNIFRKCNIDCGAFFTGCTVLLDLDTFEQHIFKAIDCIYDE